MNLLLDTHIALWWLADDPSLSELVRRQIAESSNLVAVSATIQKYPVKYLAN